MRKKPKTEWPKFKEMSRLYVTSGLDGDTGELLEIAPTMQSITVSGKRYHRLKDARQICPDGTWAALYLWDGYGQELMRRIKAGEPRDRRSVSEHAQ